MAELAPSAQAALLRVLQEGGDVIGLDDLPACLIKRFTAEREPPRSSETSTVRPNWTARIIAALTETGGKRDRATERLDVSRTTLWRKMKELGLDD